MALHRAPPMFLHRTRATGATRGPGQVKRAYRSSIEGLPTQYSRFHQVFISDPAYQSAGEAGGFAFGQHKAVWINKTSNTFKILKKIPIDVKISQYSRFHQIFIGNP